LPEIPLELLNEPDFGFGQRASGRVPGPPAVNVAAAWARAQRRPDLAGCPSKWPADASFPPGGPGFSDAPPASMLPSEVLSFAGTEIFFEGFGSVDPHLSVYSDAPRSLTIPRSSGAMDNQCALKSCQFWPRSEYASGGHMPQAASAALAGFDSGVSSSGYAPAAWPPVADPVPFGEAEIFESDINTARELIASQSYRTAWEKTNTQLMELLGKGSGPPAVQEM